MKALTYATYNLAPANDPRRGPAFVRREMHAIANVPLHGAVTATTRPAPRVIGTEEAVGRQMPNLLHHRKIRDNSTEGRANLCAYLRRGLEVHGHRWVDHKKAWPAVEHPGQTHDPRATLLVELEDDWTWILWHAPQAPGAHMPARTRKALVVAREESLDVVVGLIRSAPGPVLLTGDPNELGDDLMRRMGNLHAAGTSADSAHFRGGHVTGKKYASANGVPMFSDHGGYVRGTATRRAA